MVVLNVWWERKKLISIVCVLVFMDGKFMLFFFLSNSSFIFCGVLYAIGQIALQVEI